MGLDISNIMKEWPFEHGQVSARRITGEDGREKIQLRLDLGVLQMDATGRPDGQRPHDCDSMLDYYQQQLRHQQSTGSSDEPFELDEQACELLRAEGVMYYHRYLAEFVLEDFAAVQRDTMRNLRLMDFCRDYAADESDRYILEQYRPYVLMMHARARTRKALAANRTREALAAVRQGIRRLKTFYGQIGGEKVAKASAELVLLRAMARDIKARLPVDPVRQLRKELGQAVREERYEDAAMMRDRLREIKVHTARAHQGDPGR